MRYGIIDLTESSSQPSYLIPQQQYRPYVVLVCGDLRHLFPTLHNRALFTNFLRKCIQISRIKPQQLYVIPQTFDEQTALSYTADLPPSLLKEVLLTGTPGQVIDQVAEWRDHGLRYPQ